MITAIHSTTATICCLSTKEVLFVHLRGRWADLFGVRYDVLLYGLMSSTYFECDVSDDADDPQFRKASASE